MPRDVALVGGGHANVEVVRSFGVRPVPACRVTVFDPNPRAVYSGMVPGFVAGQYERRDVEIDLRALCERAGATFVESAVASVSDGALTLEDGTSFAFRAASLDIGSTVSDVDRPGVREFALASRPIADLVSEIEQLDTTAQSAAPLHVVGGGAGGVELAFCLEARLRAGSGRVTLVTNASAVLETSAPATRARVERALQRRGIDVLAHASVASVERDAITLSTGERIPSAGAVWVTGPASHPLAASSGLPCDTAGFVRIGPTLRVEGTERLFAAGDCASLPGMRKAGVYAVRAGPLLDRNLRAALCGTELSEYVPQDDFLSLLNLGDGTAIGSKWGRALEGRGMMWLKDRIDRAFMEKYR